MNPVAKTAVRQVTLWLVLLLVVCVCTVLFTLLGVLFTAVLTGILMGASRRWMWQAVPVSLVFPLVTFVLGQVAQDSLQPGQRVAMVALCFGTFWVIYITSMWLMRMEARPVDDEEALSSGLPATRADVPSCPADNSERTARLSSPDADTARSTGLGVRISLRDFEGTWLRETAGPDGELRTSLMTVTEGRFALEVRNRRGLARRVAEGVLSLENAAGGESLLISAGPARGS